jgi:hypothetical protein
MLAARPLRNPSSRLPERIEIGTRFLGALIQGGSAAC